jgi:hypothetical protein
MLITTPCRRVGLVHWTLNPRTPRWRILPSVHRRAVRLLGFGHSGDEACGPGGYRQPRSRSKLFWVRYRAVVGTKV